MSNLDKFYELIDAETTQSRERERSIRQTAVASDTAQYAKRTQCEGLANKLLHEIIDPLVRHAHEKLPNIPGGFDVSKDSAYSAAAYFTPDAYFPDTARTIIGVSHDLSYDNLFLYATLRLIVPIPIRQRNARTDAISLNKVDEEFVKAWVARELGACVNSYLAERADPVCPPLFKK